MKKTAKILAFCTLFFLLFAAIFQPGVVQAGGFGVSPPKIVENRLVPGSTLTRTIHLVQGTPEEDIGVLATVDSEDMKGWISFEQGSEFVIPAGVQQFPFKVTISVPGDAELGQYKAFVRVKTIPKPAEGGGQVAIALGGRIDVEVIVGDNVVVEFEVLSLRIDDIKEGKPLQVTARINNTGNVPTGPAGATFELFDKFGAIKLAVANADEKTLKEVPSFSEETLTLKFPIDIRLAPGEYRGHVRIFRDDGKIVRELITGFSVHEKTLVDVIVDTIPLAVAVVVIAGTLFYFLRRRKPTPRVAKNV